MPRKFSPFRQSDLTRAVKAARASGLDVVRTEIDMETGRIVLVHTLEGTSISPFDEWKDKRNAR